ncbi:transketolase family protein [Candidatus Caldipriscus sp.]|nr:transketolase family protein [Candidatus Caldipriscus sp.]
MKVNIVEGLGKEIPIRKAYGDFLVEIGEDRRVVVLDADLGHSTNAVKFKEKYPERYIELGIQEQNMMGIAAGLSAVGLIPFTSSFAIFSAGRPWEQIRLSIAYSNFNVKIVATHAGIATGEDGASHQMSEDISLMSSIPGMVVLSPSDYFSAKSVLRAAYKYNGYVYVRLVRPSSPTIYSGEFDYEIGNAIKLREGKDISIISTGLPVHHAVKVSLELEKEGIGVAVYDFLTVKPLDGEAIRDAAKAKYGILVVEDHVMWGGLGMVVSHFLAKERIYVPINFINLGDSFGRSGKYEDLYKAFGLDAEGIKRKVLEILGSD